MNGQVGRMKPFISDINAQACLKYALSKRQWTADYWLKVMWSDEIPFNLFPKCGKVYVRRQPGEEFQRQCLKPTIKHEGGSIMIWGCVSRAHMGKLIKVGRESKRRSLLSHITSSNGVQYETARWLAFVHFHARQCIRAQLRRNCSSLSKTTMICWTTFPNHLT